MCERIQNPGLGSVWRSLKVSLKERLRLKSAVPLRVSLVDRSPEELYRLG